MVYIKSWTRYQKEVEELYLAFPTKTRYNIKFRACDGVLVLKVTNDVKCLKHKATSAIILNRFETLNRSLLNKMANLQPKPLPSTTSSSSEPLPEASSIPVDLSEPMAIDEGAVAPPTAGGAAGAGGKKKKNKSKKK
ncbi:signal recognition particle, SRP9/SRP14 subunit [Mrakia frigida]|uniref:signal recognition particle, SRP9/SRP14 subunit n=1 Tax=Mrakia frigida TaxID=29902 RepID=UPI003FCC2738